MRSTIGRGLALPLLVLALLRFSAVLSLAQDAAPPRKDVIQFATICANYKVAIEEIAAEYEKLHPNIRIDLTIVSQGFETWIRSRMAAGGEMVPDVYNSNYTVGYERRGKFVCLDDYFVAINPYTGVPWQDTFDIEVSQRYRYAGKRYHLPIDYIEISIFYNRDIFRELGLTEPETWEEFLETCQTIQDAGIIPVAMPGDTDAFWVTSMGWMVRLLGDVYLRNYVPAVVSRPGDWDYEAERNAGYEYNPTDLYSDMLVILNNERMYNAILKGEIDFSSDRFKRVYFRLKELAQFFQPGFMGCDSNSALQLFYRQKAAMCVLASDRVTGIVQDFKEMSQDDKFDYGNFWFPPITEDPLACGPFRGLGGGGMVLSVIDKHDPEHERNVFDFLMYFTSPASGKILVERTLENDQPLIGPLLIKGVELDADLAQKFRPFMGHGYEKMNFRGLDDEQESVAEWVNIAQEYFLGRLDIDTFCNRYHQIMVDAIPRLQKRYGYDLDPSTKDSPPETNYQRNRWNPFENGSLMLLIVMALFGAYAIYHTRQATGPAKSRTRIAFLLLIPTFLLLGTFNYYPALSGLYHAFTYWEEGREATFCGLANFRQLTNDAMFYRGIINMAILLLAGLFKATVVPFLAAELILALASDRLKYIFRTLFLLPMVIPGMVGILIWRFIYDPNMGMLNQTLETLGFAQFATTSWLGHPFLALPSIIFMGFPWIGAFGLLIYMAGLMNIPKSVHEAYQLESKNPWRRILAVDIPLVNGQTRLLAILTFIGSIQDFQTILLMTRGGPGLSTYVPALRMYYQAFSYSHFGYGAAIGLVLFLAILTITIINLKVLKPAEEV